MGLLGNLFGGGNGLSKRDWESLQDAYNNSGERHVWQCVNCGQRAETRGNMLPPQYSNIPGRGRCNHVWNKML